MSGDHSNSLESTSTGSQDQRGNDDEQKSRKDSSSQVTSDDHHDAQRGLSEKQSETAAGRKTDDDDNMDTGAPVTMEEKNSTATISNSNDETIDGSFRKRTKLNNSGEDADMPTAGIDGAEGMPGEQSGPGPSLNVSAGRKSPLSRATSPDQSSSTTHQALDHSVAVDTHRKLHSPRNVEDISKNTIALEVTNSSNLTVSETEADNEIKSKGVGALFRTGSDEGNDEGEGRDPPTALGPEGSVEGSHGIKKNNQSGSDKEPISIPLKTMPADPIYLLCKLHSDQNWLALQFEKPNGRIMKPDEIEHDMPDPPGSIDDEILNRIAGSMIGMAVGDALGAHVEFQPHEYLVANPVEDLGSGGTWGLAEGQFTDDTSMALCLANSLIASHGFNPYDQLVRYKWWYKFGYMSSTGHCFDIGAATRRSIEEFHRRQQQFAKDHEIPLKDIDGLSDPQLLKAFNVECSEEGVAGNGALMRLAPVPLFFYRHPELAVEFSGYSGQITHGDRKAYDACRYYGALIVAALHGYTKDQLLDKEFYSKHRKWFGQKELHPDIKSIAEGSYQRDNGYKDGIRGKGYIVNALEAALWAFWSDKNSFEKGALAAVNLGDDTDTTAAIYGQLAGAHYGYKKLPPHWLNRVYARSFMEKLSKWITYEGESWQKRFDASMH